jgi:hypothetical protein
MAKAGDRKSLRRLRSHPAWITFAGKSHGYDCHLLDISKDGAKLLADIVAPVGSRFYLSAAENASEQKVCEIIWQKNRIFGIRFV